MTHSRRNGFSLIELLIVVAIILIIAAIAIPNLLKARMAANESSAVSSIHSILTSEITYSTVFPTVGFSAALVNLGPGACNNAAAACLIDAVLAGGVKSGYNFTYVVTAAGPPVTGYTINADPITPGVTGQRHFYSDQDMVTRYNQNAPAGVADPAIQ